MAFGTPGMPNSDLYQSVVIYHFKITILGPLIEKFLTHTNSQAAMQRCITSKDKSTHLATLLDIPIINNVNTRSAYLLVPL